MKFSCAMFGAVCTQSSTEDVHKLYSVIVSFVKIGTMEEILFFFQ
jgi:hypothetical protein